MKVIKSIIYITVISFFLLCLYSIGSAQNIQKISTRCPAPYQRTFSSLTAQSDGNINAVPCPTDNFLINGNAVASISGNGTATRFPVFTTNNQLVNSPFTWNGTTYEFFNTALDNEFQMQFTPSNASGGFNVGDVSNQLTFLALSQSANLAQLGFRSIILGDVSGANNNTRISLSDTAQTLELRGITTARNNSIAQVPFTVNTVAGQTGNLANFAVNGSNVASIDALGRGIFYAGNSIGTLGITFTGFTTTGFGTNGGNLATYITGVNALNVTASTSRIGANNQFSFSSAVNNLTAEDTGIARLSAGLIKFTNGSSGFGGFSTGAINLNRTITPTGTTGNRTINQVGGTVNLAAAASSIVVTNSLVTANSIISVIARTNDATCSVKNYVAGAGSFTINMTAACTAETSVGFIVTN